MKQNHEKRNHISFSELKIWNECPYKHKLVYIDKIKEFKGSEHNDVIKKDGTTETNYSGGVQGGISNGMDIYFNVAFKPVATVMKKQNTINKDGEEVVLEAKGRHDPCVLPRAVPIVESMAALVIADYLLIKRANKRNTK